MSQNLYVKKVLLELLNAKKENRSGRVSLLTGPWGSGKTYFWKNTITPGLQRPYLYVSAFGVESSLQLKTRLVTQFTIKTAKGVADSSVVREKAKGISGWFTPSAWRRSSHVLSTVTDTALNALISKVSLDPIELVEFIDPSTVVCIDDIERTSSKYKIEDLLGIANILSEHKGLDVVLICNEDHLIDADKSAAQVYLRYKEKTVSTQHRIDPDFDVVFEHLLSGVDETTGKEVQARKGRILELMRDCGSSNIRTLRRVLDYFAILHSLGVGAVSDHHVDFLVALTIEAAEGRIGDVEVYEFNEYMMGVSGFFDQKEREVSDLEKKQMEFLRRFNLEKRYSFVRSLYLLVRSGIVDADALKRELNPPAPMRDPLEVLLEQVKNGNWRFCSDEQISKVMESLYRAPAEIAGLNASQVLECLRYARHFAEMLGVQLDGQLGARIKERLVSLAKSGDASMSDSHTMIFEDVNRLVKDEWQAYLSAFKEYSDASEVNRLVGLVRNGRFEELSSEFLKNIDSVKLFLEKGGLGELLPRLKTSPELLFSVVGAMGRSLKSMRSIWPPASKYLSVISDEVRDIQGKPEHVGRMQAWRAHHVLKELVDG